MFFPKKIKRDTCKKRKVKLNLDLNKKCGEFLKHRNVQRVGNSLLSTFGLTKAPHPMYFAKVAFRKDKFFIALTRKQGVHAFNDRVPYRYMVAGSSDCIVSNVEYQDQIVFCTDHGTFTTENGYVATQLNSTYCKSLAVCYDRIFGVNGKNVYISSAGDITQWDDSLKITAHTELDAIVALDKLYVLGDTCYTLTPNAEEINMKFASFAYSLGAVQTESVVSLDKRVIFATTKGIFRLKSNTITPIFTELNDFVSFDGSIACVYQGKYYVICKRKDKDMTQNDIMLVLDVDNENISAVHDMQVQHINSVGDKLYVVINDELYFTSELAEESSYVETVDFDCSDIKYLDNLSIRSRSDVDVWITTDREKRRYRVSGKNTIQNLPLAGSGRQFTVEVQASSGMQLDYLELSARTYEV